jgi:hypothetical protein
VATLRAIPFLRCTALLVQHLFASGERWLERTARLSLGSKAPIRLWTAALVTAGRPTRVLA